MHEIFKDFRFEAAHFLPHVPPGHRCARLHGHSYRCRVFARGPLTQPQGWVVDFADISRAMAPLLALLDHACLNELDGLENPTAENLAQWVFQRVAVSLPQVSGIEIMETANCGALYRPDISRQTGPNTP